MSLHAIHAATVISSIQRGIQDIRQHGGNVNRVTTAPATRTALLEHVGGAVDGELIIDRARVVADDSLVGVVYLQWWEA